MLDKVQDVQGPVIGALHLSDDKLTKKNGAGWLTGSVDLCCTNLGNASTVGGLILLPQLAKCLKMSNREYLDLGLGGGGWGLQNVRRRRFEPRFQSRK